MALIIALDVGVIAWLVYVAFARGFEKVLPIAAFLLVIFPSASRIQLPGLFDLTTQRVTVLALCALYIAVGRRERDDEVREPAVLRNLLMCVVGWMLISSAESVVPSISFKSTLSQYFDFCTVYLIYARTIHNREVLNKVIAGFVAGMAGCCLFGILEVYADWKIASLFPPVAGRFAELEGLDSRGTRMQSTFDHAILFGAALSMAIPLALYLISIASAAKSRVALSIATAAMLLCIYKTGSRGPWLALILALVVVAVTGGKELRKPVWIVVICTALVVVGRPGIRDTIGSLYGATTDQDSAQGESYRWRYVLYHIATQELSRSIGRGLWGYGPESFYYLGLTTEFSIEGEMHTVKVESCDSAVVELLMDTGYVGCCLVMALISTAIGMGYRVYRGEPNGPRSAFPVLCGALLAFCFLMTNVELFGWGQQSYMLWILLAMIARKPDEECSETTTEAPLAWGQVGSGVC